MPSRPEFRRTRRSRERLIQESPFSDTSHRPIDNIYLFHFSFLVLIVMHCSCDAFSLSSDEPYRYWARSSQRSVSLEHLKPLHGIQPSKQGTSSDERSGHRPNSSSTVSSTDASHDAMETLPPNRAKRRKAISKKDFQLEVSMMNHDLLSKDEEYELSRLYHTAKQLQTRIDVLLSEKNLQLEARQKLSRNGGDISKGFPDKTKTDDLFVRDDECLEASQSPDSAAFISYRNYEEWQQIDAHPKSITAKSTMLERMDQSSRTTMAAYFFNDSDEYVDPKELSTTFAAELTEEDIVSSLQIPGGRKEIESILLNGASARDTLIRSNLKLVSSICKRWARIFSKSGSDSNDSLFSIYSGGWDRPSLSEATQEGVIGLATAVERFDPSRGLRFSTYATYWITNSVRQCFQRSSTGCLRLPINYYDTRTRFKTLVRHYYEMDGSVPSMDVLARELGLPERRLHLILSLTQPLVSMDGLLRPKGGLTRAGKAGNVNRLEDNLLLSDTLPDASSDRADYSSNPMDRVELSFLRQQLEHAMAVELVPFERDVLRLRLGLDDGVMRTCREVAVECGGRLKSSEIRSTEQRALKKLRSPVALATYKLLTYLDFADVDIKTISLR